ncbi:hypothetical protein HY570_04090, partial [Candidatus Micrarchaeota archaeon]|nr:hypothetical protein [Candidatus Micrarchaeota archaeon]
MQNIDTRAKFVWFGEVCIGLTLLWLILIVLYFAIPGDTWANLANSG